MTKRRMNDLFLNIGGFSSIVSNSGMKEGSGEAEEKCEEGRSL